MVYTSLDGEKLSTENILIYGTSKGASTANYLRICNRALYGSLIASIGVLDNVERWVKIRT